MHMALRKSIYRIATQYPAYIRNTSRCLGSSRRNHLDEHSHSSMKYPRLSKQQVSAYLQTEECSVEINHEAVSRKFLHLCPDLQYPPHPNTDIHPTQPDLQYPPHPNTDSHLKTQSFNIKGWQRYLSINSDLALLLCYRFDNCRLAANQPIEDRNAEGYCNATDGYLFGIFDGHAGVANAQAVSERLFNYIAVNLLSPDLLAEFCERLSDPKEELNLVKFLTHNTTYFSKEFSSLYRNAIVRYANETLSTISDWEEHFSMEAALQSAFEKLDNDVKHEAFPSSHNYNKINSQMLAVALTGCCGVTAHIDGPHLHVANAGDCGAILGTQNDDGSWEAKPLTIPHSVANKSERRRLSADHPNEKNTVIKDGRLLGSLEPTRAFGDFRFKMPAATLRETGELVRTLRPTEDEMGAIIPAHYYEPPQYYYTPPYVTAQPEVQYHHLRPKDKFLILATDGLWNMFPNNDTKVVQLVADHMYGAQTIADFQLPKDSKLELGELNEILKIRKLHIAKRAEDTNCATHLIRNAIGQTEQGVSHGKLSAMLTLPNNFVRYYRDDITVTVVYFDETYLKANLNTGV